MAGVMMTRRSRRYMTLNACEVVLLCQPIVVGCYAMISSVRFRS
jgi:hypothetical protein